jgi:hypothetical protein
MAVVTRLTPSRLWFFVLIVRVLVHFAAMMIECVPGVYEVGGWVGGVPVIVT